MMFDFEMFHRLTPRLTGSDLTKAMEMELLRENIYTEYMEEVVCYCKKTEDTSGYSKERQRWLKAQYKSFLIAITQFPFAFLQGKWDLCEKLFQWLMPSRLLLIAYIVLCALAMTMLDWTLCLKWYVLLGILFLSYLLALPEGEINHRFRKAFWTLPLLIFTFAFSHFKHTSRKTRER